MAIQPILELARRVRLCVNSALPLAAHEASDRQNTFAAWPGMSGLGAFYEFEVRCQGKPDAITGYLMNISVIDEIMRRIGLPIIHAAMSRNAQTEPAIVLRSFIGPLQDAIGDALDSVQWRLTPYYSITMSASQQDRVMISQQFEFAAAHRLHVDSLTAEENRRVFGRCNNPNFHGHNYRLEVSASVALTEDGPLLTVMELERHVNAHVIERLDHKNLNIDVPEFQRVNPSVENIAKVCFELLQKAINESGAELSHVTAWETEKTSCTYPARCPHPNDVADER